MTGTDGTPYITEGQARQTLQELFSGVHGQMVAQNAENQGLIAQLRSHVQQAIVESLRGHTRTAVSELDAKLASAVESMELCEATRKTGEEELLKTFEEGVHEFAASTRLGIRTMIAEGRSADGTSVSTPFQERDRSVCDPRDYKLDDVISTQMSLGVWKKRRLEIEIYVDAIGPSWRGVKLVLQQARHSAFPLEPTVPSMDNVWQSAKKATNHVEPFDPAAVDYATKAATLCRILIPKFNFDLLMEFSNSAPDNVFELWRLLDRKLNPPVQSCLSVLDRSA